jgi:outer membrane receptor for ferric coprogen and ferric-rhodotorulic acid
LANVTAQDPVITDNPQGVTSVGNRPQGAPAYLANLWTTYDFAIAGVPGFRIGGGLNYQLQELQRYYESQLDPGLRNRECHAWL